MRGTHTNTKVLGRVIKPQRDYENETDMKISDRLKSKASLVIQSGEDTAAPKTQDFAQRNWMVFNKSRNV